MEPSNSLENAIESLRAKTAALRNIDIAGTVRKIHSDIELSRSTLVKPGKLLLSSEPATRAKLVDAGRAPSESEQLLQDRSGDSAVDDESQSGSDEWEISDDPMDMTGPGDLVVEGKIIRVHDWLGSEWEKQIRVLHSLQPLEHVPGLRTEPFEWQKTGAARINMCCEGPMRGCIVGDEMGLGKSLTVIMACLASPPTRPASFDLIVTTKTCVPQWQEELTSHFHDANRPRVVVLNDPRTKAMDLLQMKPDFVIVTYEFLQARHHALQKYEDYFERVAKVGRAQADAERIPARTPHRPTLSLFSPIYEVLNRFTRRLILDEAQRIKNHLGLTHAAIKDLPYEAIIMLSGTFIANKWSDCYGLVDCLAGHPFSSFQEFLRVFASRTGHRWGDPSITRQNRLIKFLQAFTFARPSSLLDLPGIYMHHVPFKLSGWDADYVSYYTKRFYETLRRTGASTFSTSSLLTDEDKKIALGYATRAQQLAANAALLSTPHNLSEARIREEGSLLRKHLSTAIDEHHTGITNSDHSARMVDYIMAILTGQVPVPGSTELGAMNRNSAAPETASSHDLDQWQDVDVKANDHSTEDRRAWLRRVHDMQLSDICSPRVQTAINKFEEIQKIDSRAKVVFFSKYLKLLDLVEEGLWRKLKVKALRFDGTKSDEERLKVRRLFESTNEPILITAGAGGAGMNLATGNHLIQLEPWWNGNDERQAYFRLHRKGQTREVHVWNLVAENSLIDLVIRVARDRKMTLNDKFMDQLRRRDDEPPITPPIGRYI